ncbi:LysR substrate-binding domain-containing protein [Methylopila musalis]|uniref:LysR substrate-binding domain-containing protein n=1 Tax=Methylopila musalis TaxID=1134781 RepID=A0ABW3Z6J1_9HYPH
MRRLPPLASLRAFEAAARRLSFKDAATELGVTPTAVSHQIRQLEESLGAALFERAPRKVALTPRGAALAGPLRRAFDAMDAAVAEARRTPARRVATLSATVAFTAKLLVPKAARFREMNPDWDLRLHAADTVVDLAAGEADAAIRYGAGPRPGLTGAPLMTDLFAPLASPRLNLSVPADLARVTLIHFDWQSGVEGSTPSWRRWGEAAGVAGVDWESGVAFNDEASAIQAAVAGQGAALLSRTLVASELASGLLVQPFGPELRGFAYEFVCPEGAEDRPAVAALRRWIEAEVAPGA